MTDSPHPSPVDRRPGRLRRVTGWCWRWTKRLAVVALIAGIVLRLALPFLGPTLVGGALSLAGLEGEVRRTQFGFLTGRVEIWGLRLPTIDDRSLPDLRVESMTVDLSVGALLTGSVLVQRLEINGADLHARRDADGSWHGFVDLSGMGEGEASEPEADPPPAEPFRPAALLELPVAIEALRVQGVRLHVVDEAATDDRDRRRTIAVDVRVADLGVGRPASVELSVQAPRLADAVRLAIGLERGDDDTVAVTADFTTEGFRPFGLLELVPSLAESGIRPEAQSISAHLELDGQLTPMDDDLSIELNAHHIEVAADRAEALAVDDLKFGIGRWSSGGIEDLHAEIDGLRGAAARAADSSLLLAGFRFGEAAAKDASEPVPLPKPAEATAADTGTGTEQPAQALTIAGLASSTPRRPASPTPTSTGPKPAWAARSVVSSTSRATSSSTRRSAHAGNCSRSRAVSSHCADSTRT